MDGLNLRRFFHSKNRMIIQIIHKYIKIHIILKNHTKSMRYLLERSCEKFDYEKSWNV